MLSAAVEVVEEVGYSRMTVTQVIGRAGVSRKTFYDFFADREDCFLAVFEQALSRARLRASEAYEREAGWREGTRSALATLLLLIDEEPALARLCIIEALGPARASWSAVRSYSPKWRTSSIGAVSPAARPATRQRSQPKRWLGRSSRFCTHTCWRVARSR